MICYVASYPRSGNAWIRTLLLNQLGLLSSTVHGDIRKQRNNKIVLTKLPHYEFIFPLFLGKLFPALDLPEGVFWIFYIVGVARHLRIRRTLPKGVGKILENTHARARIAKANDPIVIKTHSKPYDVYSEDEYFIFVIRNPGAALWSYYNYTRDIQQETPSLDEMILGKVGFGDWSEYQRAWIQKRAELNNNRFQIIRYEDMFNSELKIASQIGKLLKTPVISNKLVPFSDLQKERPRLARQGQPFGWERHYSKDQLRELWKLHGEVMMHYGYSEPNYEQGLENAAY